MARYHCWPVSHWGSLEPDNRQYVWGKRHSMDKSFVGSVDFVGFVGFVGFVCFVSDVGSEK